MYKKFVITLFSIFLFSFNAIAASDGELVLPENNEPKKTKDCFEKLNRVTFSFNQGLDKAVIRPIAKGYRKLPDPIQKGTSNAVKNLSNLILKPFTESFLRISSAFPPFSELIFGKMGFEERGLKLHR